MKILTDKIEGNPPHGITGHDVRSILARIPPDWIQELTDVRLANVKHGPEAFFNRHDGLLTIYSRYGTKRQILFAILSVLAAPSLNIKSSVSRRPSKADQHRLEQFLQPLIERILPDLTPAKRQSPEAQVPWQPVPFPNDAP